MTVEQANEPANERHYQQENVASEIITKIEDLNNDVGQYKENIQIDINYNQFKVYQHASMRVRKSLYEYNKEYEISNKIPPKKMFNTFENHQLQKNFDNSKESLTAFKKKIFAFRKNKEIYGKEASVQTHIYDDLAPLCVCVDTFKALYIPKNVKYIWPDRKLQFSEGTKLKADIQSYLKLSDTERLQNMQELTEVRYVTQEDTKNNACDVEIIGHKGVFAKQDIPKYSVIGVYSGVFLKDKHDMMKLAMTLPHHLFQDYLFCISMDKPFPKVSAFRYGNSMSMVNASSNHKDNNSRLIAEKLHRRSNIMPTAVKTLECNDPKVFYNEDMADMLFFIAGRDIPKGEQLLYDYGPKYW